MKQYIRNLKIKSAQNSELFFYREMKSLGVFVEKLDIDGISDLKVKYLKDINGKCPDFYCKKRDLELFVEVKTLTNLTNEEREKDLGVKGFVVTFDATNERRGPIKNLIKDSSKKFKNIDENYSTPRLIFLNGLIGSYSYDLNALLCAVYPCYMPIGGKTEYVGQIKKNGERGIFDKTGASVSGVIYWSDKFKNFCLVPNPNAKYEITRKFFLEFFYNESPTPPSEDSPQ